MHILHEEKIVHRDIKLSNIFMMSNGALKLGDLGYSRLISKDGCYTVLGTQEYCSPQLASHSPILLDPAKDDV